MDPTHFQLCINVSTDHAKFSSSIMVLHTSDHLRRRSVDPFSSLVTFLVASVGKLHHQRLQLTCKPQYTAQISLFRLPQGAKYCGWVCLPWYVRNHISNFATFSVHVYLWPWLSPMVALQYVTFYQFCGWRHVFIQWTKWRYDYCSSLAAMLSTG